MIVTVWAESPRPTDKDTWNYGTFVQRPFLRVHYEIENLLAPNAEQPAIVPMGQIFEDGTEARVYLQSPKANLLHVGHTMASSSTNKGVVMHIADMAPGTYTVRWVDPATGETVTTYTGAAKRDGLHIPVPKFTRNLSAFIAPGM